MLENYNELEVNDYDLFGNAVKLKPDNILSERFEYPPFSILNAREGVWQKRKRQWLSLGIQSELGRGAQVFNTQDWFDKHNCSGAEKGNTSIFDPFLCELMYKWFCRPEGKVLDPFAGGSVRGIVAGVLGLNYLGIELSGNQVQANIQQKEEILPDGNIEWINGDSLKELPLLPNDADFIFSCPPYGDLEVYSDDPSDLSNMPHEKFIEIYSEIIYLSCSKLKQNRFACFVVGDYREKKTGHYRNFVGDTITAFLKAGLHLYNEAILITSIGSLPIRITKQFNASRKLGKTHQNILVFVKGDPTRVFNRG